MSRIRSISIHNYRAIKNLYQDFGEERFIVLIGRGDSGKSTILSAIHAALNPSWNASFSDLDFYNQDTSNPIEIILVIDELPDELFKETQFGFYMNDNGQENPKLFSLKVKLVVDSTLEPHWYAFGNQELGIEDKPISAQSRASIGVNFITDYADTHFAYNRQSPLYALTKASLEDDVKIEHIKSQVLRDLSSKVDKEKMAPLNTPLGSLKSTARMLGLSIEDLRVSMDISENPYTGNSVALHHNGLPYRTQGKGSKRLMSIAIQSELTKTGGIVLIDEIEQGLEPDRITTLVRILKGTNSGQIFITTHSLNVILEAESKSLFVVRQGDDCLFQVPDSLDACRRSNPQALFSRKIICCEGKTEFGIWREIDRRLNAVEPRCFLSVGVALVNSNGGNNMYTYSMGLKSLGYDVCIFADNDTNQEKAIAKVEAADIPVFICDDGNCIEKQIINDLPWDYVIKLIECPQENFPSKNIDISDELMQRITNSSSESQLELRREIGKLSVYKEKKPNGKIVSHEWFKHIPGGEFLGSLIFDYWTDQSFTKDNKLCDLIKSVLEWSYGKSE